MKKLLLLLMIFYAPGVFAQAGIGLSEYSYAEFFQMVENEKDTIFRLNDALIEYNPKTDQRFRVRFYAAEEDTLPNQHETLTVEKAIILDNVHFISSTETETDGFTYSYGTFYNIHFKKQFTVLNNVSLSINRCRFDQQFLSRLFYCKVDGIDNMRLGYVRIQNSIFSSLDIVKVCRGNSSFGMNYFVDGNTINQDLNLTLIESERVTFEDNLVKSPEGIRINSSGNSLYFFVTNNKFIGNNISFSWLNSSGRLNYEKNTFSSKVSFIVDELKGIDNIPWSQIENFSYSGKGFETFVAQKFNVNYFRLSPAENEQAQKLYLDSARLFFKDSYNYELALKGQFYRYYKNQFNSEAANEAYIDLKDFETERLQIIYTRDKGFRTYFRWKVNQFLKLFSDYGTDPSKAIVFSVYVILAFALVYLFFPNHWDSHGKNRIKDRFLFFHKYLRLNKGIQDVYLEGQQEEIESSHAFRKVLDDHKDEVPAFFYNAAGPLLKWSTAGTTIYSKLLSRVDFLKGSWKDTDPKVRGLKTALTIIIFFIALCYDILIKMLNALMLSINTFTTLGFGEIPIKGLPRYLAIIQGFIGWFMLTIFSVSLISQLLN